MNVNLDIGDFPVLIADELDFAAAFEKIFDPFACVDIQRVGDIGQPERSVLVC